MSTYDDLNVDIGNAPDDDQGDPLRTAFDKINQRFAELRVFLNNRGDWAPNTAYTADPNRDWVIVDGVGYLATSNHTSGATFAADLAAGKWVAADALEAIQAVDTLRADLASTAAGKGAELVAATDGVGGSIFTTVAGFITRLMSSAGSTLVGFIQAGTGAVFRWIQDKLRETVSAKDFGAVGDGVADDTAAIQAALNTGKAVFLPVGVYKLTAPVTLSTVGQRLYGESSHTTYLTGGVNHDQVRIEASHCEVDHIHFRPSGFSDTSPPAFAPIRIYAALAHVHDNRFLAASAGHGTAIFCDDVNPATSAIVAGAYIHTIKNNRIGASGYDFKVAVFCYNANNGMQATKFQNNQILGDVGFYTYYGGGNDYVGNLLQSATGGYAAGTRAGNGIDLQSGVVGETITGNYIERYNHGVIVRRAANDYLAANVYGNHWDNNDNNFTSTGTAFYRFMDDERMTLMSNAWQEDFNSQDNFKFKNREGVEVYNINRASASVEPRVFAHNLFQSLPFNGNGVTETPVASWCEITGGGDHRTGCFLGNGTRPGQHLYLRAHSWSVQILNNPGGTQNIVFAGGASSATFGQSGNVGTMHLIWDATYGGGRWFEVSRTIA